jgi:hypothetical protein
MPNTFLSSPPKRARRVGKGAERAVPTVRVVGTLRFAHPTSRCAVMTGRCFRSLPVYRASGVRGLWEATPS